MARLTLIAAALVVAAGTATAAEAPKAPSHDWGFQGIFGSYDRAALRRGYQVYAEVCAGCHSLRLVAYRNLMEIGFTEDEVTEIASEFEVLDGPDDEGEMFTRPAKAADYFVPPFPNDNAARFANNGSLPPDLSLITKARKGGPDYLYALLTGYREEPPEGFQMMDGMVYNDYFPGHQISMPQPLFEDMVEYADGTPATVDQMSEDVTVFLAWAGSPELEARKSLGIKVLLFTIVLTAMLYALKRRIWADVH